MYKMFIQAFIPSKTADRLAHSIPRDDELAQNQGLA
jgi:hypothetical protein